MAGTMGWMGKAKDGWWVCAVVVAATVSGCHSGPPPVFETWSSNSEVFTPRAGSGNAWDDYAVAASEAEAHGGAYLDRVTFTPERKARVIQICSGPIQRITSGSRYPCDFKFTPAPPFEIPPYHRGWRLISRAMVWRIQEAVTNNDLSKALSGAVVATKFGFDLCGGGAMDASLGLVIVDEARAALAPALGRLTAEQKESLANGLARALSSKPPIERLIQNEERNMMAAVQAVQDAYQQNRLEDLQTHLGTSAKPAIEFLKGVAQKDAEKRPSYFRGFAREATEECQWILRVASVPGSERASQPGPLLDEERPWRRLAQAFFPTLRPLFGVHGSFLRDKKLSLGLYDSSVARTKLLALHMLVSRRTQGGKADAPANLDAIDRWLTLDPLSGQPFVYRVDGPDFTLYSVGADLRDDGGATDETCTYPDLRLED